jgi:hypothetical protein
LAGSGFTLAGGEICLAAKEICLAAFEIYFSEKKDSELKPFFALLPYGKMDGACGAAEDYLRG